MRTGLALCAAVAAAVLVLAQPASANHGTTVVASSAENGTQGNGSSSRASMSAGGRFVAFVSTSTNLTAEDTTPDADVFRKDLATGEVRLVSTGLEGEASTGFFGPTSISADGATVAFAFEGSDNRDQVYIRDMASAEPQRMTEQPADISGAYAPALSNDGNRAVFASNADNLGADGVDVFLWTRGAGVTRLGNPDPELCSASPFPDISPDGGTVVVEGSTAEHCDSIVRIPTSGGTFSYVPGSEAESPGHSYLPEVSSGGEHVTWLADVSSGRALYRDGALVEDEIFLLGSLTHTSDDGRFLSWGSFATDVTAEDTAGDADAFHKDMTTGEVRVASAGPSESGFEPSISGDGSSVAYEVGSQVKVRQLLPRPPRNVSAPRVFEPAAAIPGASQGVRPGDVLVCGKGEWENASAFAYEWFRNGSPIAGETGEPYQVRDGDQNAEIDCQVTATGSEGSVSRRSENKLFVGLRGERPVIFVPGFMASEIDCTNRIGNRDNLWPDALLEFTEFLYMTLGSDGRSPLVGADPCNSSAGAGRSAVASVLAGPARSNIHGDTMAWLDRTFPGRNYVYAYDWRKSPVDALAGLDRLIDTVREKHGGDKVSIVTHSNGGLVTRWYIDDAERAKKVAAVADYGTPFWGTPKPWWTVAFGVELPTLLEPGPDPLVPNAVLKTFARNLAGLYYLFPSDAWYQRAGALHSKWLTVGPLRQDRNGVLAMLSLWGGNRALAEEALAGHRDHIAGFKTNGVDFRVLVGTGLPTIASARHALPPPAPSALFWEEATFAFTNGDGTVAMFSQRQAGPDGVVMGEQVPTYYFCGIGHMGEPEHPELQKRIQDFLNRGGAEGGGDIAYDVKGSAATGEGQLSDRPCPLTANKFELIRAAGEPKSDIPLSIALALETEGVLARRVAGAAVKKMTLADAERRGLVQVTNVGRRMLITTNTREKLTLTVKGRKFAVRTAALTDAGTKGEATYGPLSGSVTLTGAAGSKVRARQGKRTLKPSKKDRRPPKVSVKVKRKGKTATLTFAASDPSGVGAFYVTNAGQPVAVKKRVARVLVKALPKVRFSAVDLFGNATKSMRVPKR